MKFLLSLVVLAALAMPVFAGEDCGGSCPLSGESSEFDCQNRCPLAKMANRHRALGTEALTASKTMRAENAKTVARNLAKI